MDNYQKVDTKRMDKREAKKNKESNIYTSKHIRNVINNCSTKNGDEKKEDKKNGRNKRKKK